MGEVCDWVGTLLLQRPGLCIKQRHAGGKTHGTGDTVMEAVTWMCVSRECGLSPLYLSFVLFLFLSLLPHFKRPVLFLFSTPSCFFHEITRLSPDPSHRTQFNCLGGRLTMSSLSSLMLLSQMRPEKKKIAVLLNMFYPEFVLF